MLDRKARQENERQALHKEKEEAAEKLMALRSKKFSLEAKFSQLNFELERVAKLKSQEGTNGNNYSVVINWGHRRQQKSG